ncbi:MAG TPA: M13 family metallopeptidase N-terminal domain-containing protein, partial [Microlunatus sp.]|nr:M13 family metallopeptidase N-terminal domain-containing protein [Microlunatus sp.]
MTQPTPALDFSTFDTDVRVQDDLFRHVNGTWIERTPIPDDKPLTGSFMVLRDDAEAAVRDIITGMDRSEAPDGSDEAKIADLYASFLDTDAIEAAGAQPLDEVFARIDAVTEVPELIELMGALARVGVRGLIGVDTESDPGDPNRYVMFVGQSGLGLPDEAYYREPQYVGIREAYLAHIARMLGLADVAGVAHSAQHILDLETAIAGCHWDKVKTRDMKLMYN